jgi:hypothetical protein
LGLALHQAHMEPELEQKVLTLYLTQQHPPEVGMAELMEELVVIAAALAVQVAGAQEALEQVVRVIHQALLQAKEIMVVKVLMHLITLQGVVVVHLKQVQTQLALPLVKVVMEPHLQ